MGFSVDGLSSSLDTTALINGLMQVEAIPQNLLKRKVAGTQSTINALQQLNTQIAALATQAKVAAKPDALNLFTAKTGSDAATATATTGASAASLSFAVAKLAQTQVIVTDAITEWAGTTVTITGADGPVDIAAASASLDDMVAAINASETGVTALKVAAGTNGLGEPQYRVQLTSNESGAAAGFTIDGSIGTTQITAAQDAEITLWAGTMAEQSITSATNSFENLLPGVNVTAKTVTTDPVTLTVARDTSAASKVAENFVGGINSVLATISTRTVVTNSTDASGKPVLSSRVFTGDSTVRTVNQKIVAAASAPVDDISPSSIGINITKTGTFEFDSEKFARALADDPARVQGFMQAIADRVASAATEASDKYDGLISSKITGHESLVTSMNTQIGEWDTRLTSREATLRRTFVAMEVRLSAINSQSAWLTTQLSSLTPRKD